MTAPGPAPITIQEGRFARFEAIEWWDQSVLDRARVLLVGAGALGNEVLKNLALLGAGCVVVVDKDRVERSNLSRSVLFRETDDGLPKSECAARAARAIYPDLRAVPIVGDVTADVGLGYFRWAHVIVGALDNREARLFVNTAAARTARPWLDGGIEILQGIVRGFAPPQTACYECTMSKTDWDLLNQRRSCSLLARKAAAQRGAPTTPTTASVIGAIQAQEVLKLLHGIDALLGRGFFFEGARHSSYAVQYPINPDCPWHEPPAPIEPVPDFGSGTTVRALWEWATRALGPLDAIDLGREIIRDAQCPDCKAVRSIFLPANRVTEDEILCPRCRVECAPNFLHSIGPEPALLDRTVRELGLPAWDIVWARRGADCLGIELAGDRPPGLTADTANEPAKGQAHHVEA